MLITKILIAIILFLLGAAIGSFLNVVILRTEKKEDFVKGRSYCPHCKETLTARELIPLISFVIQGGKCRHCKAKISWQYPIVELISGVSYVIAFLALGVTLKLPIALVLFPVLLALSVIDIRIGEIPYWCNIVIAALGVVAFVISFVSPQNTIWYEHIIGLFVISVPFAVFAFLGAMGGGDVQLVATAGFLLGWAIVPSALIALIIGAMAGVVIKLRKKDSIISFGPYLAIGIAVGFLVGNDIIEWYIRLLG